MAKALILTGLVLILLGLLWPWLAKMSFLGRLPGDILIEKKDFTFYFPVTTSILVSLFLSLVIWFFSRHR
ncbi:MAG: DUF2905 domain-containing protein [Candidatus Omnitrophota bacterium]